MSPLVKLLIGLAATLLMGWVWHGPLGNGAALIGAIETQAKAEMARTEVTGIDVRLGRDPLSRAAILSGAADRFQREGMGSQKGLTEIVGGVKGVSSVRWADEAQGGGGLPLLAETLILLALSYLIGLGVAWLFWGRPKRESYL
jgi:hypothetical protein